MLTAKERAGFVCACVCSVRRYSDYYVYGQARGQGSGQRQGSGPARRRPGTDKPQTEFFSANFANDTPMPQTACLDLDSVPPCRSGPSPRQDMVTRAAKALFPVCLVC